jgi:hypothetical protein
MMMIGSAACMQGVSDRIEHSTSRKIHVCTTQDASRTELGLIYMIWSRTAAENSSLG